MILLGSTTKRTLLKLLLLLPEPQVLKDVRLRCTFASTDCWQLLGVGLGRLRRGGTASFLLGRYVWKESDSDRALVTSIIECRPSVARCWRS